MVVSGLGGWSIGLFLLKLGLRPSYIFNYKASLFQAWIMDHFTCPFEAGPSARLHSAHRITIVSGLGCWSTGLDLLTLGSQPGFIFSNTSLLILDLNVGQLDLSRPSFISNNKSVLFLDLDVGPLDLPLRSCACGPASCLIANHSCFWTWMLEHWTYPFEAGPWAQLHS